MSNPVKVVHISSAHKDGDVRIFLKECVSLANAGFDVSMIIPNSVERTEKGVKIISVDSKVKSRFFRAWKTVNAVYKKAVDLDGDIYHLHDPELLRIAVKLKRKGKKVVYDAHEDLPRQIMAKSYIPSFFRNWISALVEKYENKKVAKLDGVICATPFIRDRFVRINSNSVDVNNFPITEELLQIEPEKNSDHNTVCYVGSINEVRGVYELVQALNHTSCKLILAGEFDDEKFYSKLKSLASWKNVEYVGFADRKKVAEIYSRSKVGIVTLHPFSNYMDALPVKMFEYMAAGMPVVSSNFPQWEKIISDVGCGMCVDPKNSDEIAQAINRILAKSEMAEIMSQNGKRAIREKYNWEIEKEKLIIFYKKLSAG